MRICVINFSGNVGKTTVAAHLLQPRLAHSKLFSVESLNLDAEADGVDVHRLKAQRYSDLQREMLMRDSAVVDVGASNVEAFMKLMQQYAGSHEDYHAFVVPAVKERKQLSDTISTLQALGTLGVAPKRIRLVLNKVEPDDDVEHDFASLIGFAQSMKLRVSLDAVIYANEVFEQLKGTGRTLGEVMSDPVDYREQLRQAGSQEEKELCVQRIAIKRLAASCVKNLDATFAALLSK